MCKMLVKTCFLWQPAWWQPGQGMLTYPTNTAFSTGCNSSDLQILLIKAVNSKSFTTVTLWMTISSRLPLRCAHDWKVVHFPSLQPSYQPQVGSIASHWPWQSGQRQIGRPLLYLKLTCLSCWSIFVQWSSLLRFCVWDNAPIRPARQSEESGYEALW